jgi:hypothetical protein
VATNRNNKKKKSDSFVCMIILNIIGNFVRHILGTIVEIINYYIPNCVGRQHFNDIMRFIGFIIGLLYIQALAVFIMKSH